MANSTPSRPGQNNLTGSASALFADIFKEEVLATYEATTQMRGLHRVENLKGAKSLKFPVMGTASGGYHTVGTEITGDRIAHSEISVGPDDKLVSSVFVADIDELMIHYGLRAGYAREIGSFLARNFDANVIRAAVLAARQNAPLNQGNSSPIVQAALLTDVTKLFDAFSAAKQKMDEKNVDVVSKPIYGLVKTAQWYALQTSEKLRNRDYNPSADVAKATDVLWIDGIQVRKSNLAPFGDDNSATVGLPARYQADFTKTAGVVWTPDAVITAEVQGISIQHEEQISKQGHLIVGRYMSGTAPMRATDAVELRIAA